MSITQELIRELLDYNPESGIFIWKKITDRHMRFIGTRAGSVYKNGYRYIDIKGKAYREHRVAWLYVYGTMPAQYLDHINGDKADNRIANLRECNPMLNEANKGPSKSNTSGIVGVRYEASRKRWRADIMVNGKQKALGRFHTKEEAIAVRHAAAVKHFGKFMHQGTENV